MFLKMSGSVAVLFVCFNLLTSDVFANDPDVEKLNGIWRATSTSDGGRDTHDNVIIEVKDGKYKTWVNGKYQGSGEYLIDSGKNPKHQDTIFTVNGVQRVMLGIYELNGDILTCCYADAGLTRPKTFEVPSRGMRITYQRDSTTKAAEPKLANQRIATIRRQQQRDEATPTP